MTEDWESDVIFLIPPIIHHLHLATGISVHNSNFVLLIEIKWNSELFVTKIKYLYNAVFSNSCP